MAMLVFTKVSHFMDAFDESGFPTAVLFHSLREVLRQFVYCLVYLRYFSTEEVCIVKKQPHPRSLGERERIRDLGAFAAFHVTKEWRTADTVIFLRISEMELSFCLRDYQDLKSTET